MQSDICHFFVRSNYVWKLRYSYGAFLFVNLLYFFFMSELHYKCFSYIDMFFMTLGLRFFMVHLHYIRK